MAVSTCEAFAAFLVDFLDDGFLAFAAFLMGFERDDFVTMIIYSFVLRVPSYE